MAKALDLSAADPVVDLNYGPTLSATLEGLEKLAGAESWDRAAACFPIPFPKAGVKRGADPALKEAVAELRKRCKTRMETVELLFGADSASVLAELRALAPTVETLFDLVREFGQRFYQEKARRGLLEFSDAEHLAVRLLERPEVRELLREQFVEIMVDEYQDTNEVQNVLFDALSQDGENLFLVGDVKQSIYRFRLADPTIFLGKYTSWTPAAQAQKGQPRKLILSRNFRSRPQVLHAVNYVFENLMSRACGEMEYGPEEALYPPDDCPPPDPACAAELDVIALPEGEGGEDEVDKSLIEARFVARRMAQMLREGFPVDDGAGGGARCARMIWSFCCARRGRCCATTPAPWPRRASRWRRRAAVTSLRPRRSRWPCPCWRSSTIPIRTCLCCPPCALRCSALPPTGWRRSVPTAGTAIFTPPWRPTGARTAPSFWSG